jgi:hypothetical protein
MTCHPLLRVLAIAASMSCAPQLGTLKVGGDVDTGGEAGGTGGEAGGTAGGGGADPAAEDETSGGPTDEREDPPADDTGTVTPTQEDDALMAANHLPATMSCGEVASGAIAVRNTGTAHWTRDAGYKLGTVDDEDPFYNRDTRVWLTEEDVVPSGDLWTFEFELEAPETPGTYVTDWQMVHEGVRWFGDTTVHEIEVACDAPDTPAGPPNLDEVVWLHTDVSDWDQTGVLSSVSISGDQICLDYDKADVWPIYDADGTDVVGNPWIFIFQDDTWYAGTWEWLRPGQTCKAMDSVAGSHIKIAPFEEDSGWTPTSGQTYWFMVSGLGRWSERNVEERTNLVSFVWP